MAALDAYLAAAPLAEVLAYTALAVLALGLAPFAIGHAADHAAAARGDR